MGMTLGGRTGHWGTDKRIVFLELRGCTSEARGRRENDRLLLLGCF